MYQTKFDIIKLEKYLLYGLILSMATYAIPFLRIGGDESKFPIGTIFLPLLFFLLAIRSSYTKNFVSNKILTVSMFLLYFSVILSSFLPGNFLVKERIAKLIIFLSFPILFTNVIRDNKSLKTCLWSLVTVGIILGVYGFYGYFTGNIGEDTQKAWWWTYARYYGIHYTPSTRNSDIYYIVIPLIITLVFLSFANLKSTVIKAFLTGLSLMFFIGLLLSFSRGGWVSTIITIFIFLLIFWKKRNIYLRKNLRMWLIIILVPLFFIISNKVLNYFGMANYFIGKAITIFRPAEASYYLQEKDSFDERIELFKITLDIVISNPLGVGPDNLRYIYPSYFIGAQHPESNYLHVLAENGIIGFLGYSFFVFYPLIFFYRKVVSTGNNDWVR
ncbi:MAG TPA: hypothetical protein DHV62_03775, partial [Elusimicrobia bacterium]|nr:hypothetical protein [Elusimicrobiota bacterium]